MVIAPPSGKLPATFPKLGEQKESSSRGLSQETRTEGEAESYQGEGEGGEGGEHRRTQRESKTAETDSQCKVLSENHFPPEGLVTLQEHSSNNPATLHCSITASNIPATLQQHFIVVSL